MRDGVRKTRCAVESTCVNATDPILDCDTAPQNAPRMSDLQSRPTKVSQTMSCHTASRRSGRHELVSSTTATTDLHEPSECVVYSLVRSEISNPHAQSAPGGEP